MLAEIMTRVLIALALLPAYAAFAYARPDRPCRRCSGSGGRTRRRRRSGCGRCKGTGRQFRFGARFVHRAVIEVRKAAREVGQRREAGQ